MSGIGTQRGQHLRCFVNGQGVDTRDRRQLQFLLFNVGFSHIKQRGGVLMLNA